MLYDKRRNELQEQVLNLSAACSDALVLEIFRFQAEHCAVYSAFLQLLKIDAKTITNTAAIPFLPISVFKTNAIKSGSWETDLIFKSSGTTGMDRSKHHVRSEPFYRQICQRIFEQFYGPLTNYRILALLPSYLENGDSSLVNMCQHFIDQSGSGGFFLDDFDALEKELMKEVPVPKTILLGVTYALLDFAERVKGLQKDALIVMETGGMKGRREAMTRHAVHDILKSKFAVSTIHSEYGMTEMFSQAYSLGEGVFQLPNSVRIEIGSLEDPLAILPIGRKGRINVIDLANIDACCFIQTEDYGHVNPDGTFNVLGRIEASDLRGCNLLYPSS